MNKPALPPEIDPELWFPCAHNSQARDYLLNAKWHTFVGRMQAYCPDRQVYYRVSKSTLPDETLPLTTKYWVQGFLAGNMPRQPVDTDTKAMEAWKSKVDAYFRTGVWEEHDKTLFVIVKGAEAGIYNTRGLLR